MKRKTCLVFSACALTVAPAFSNGFYVPVQAPEATARGNAWLATADTASAVYYNAAGLTQIDSPQVVVGGYAIMLGLEANIGGKNYKADNDWAVLPQIYGAVPINDKLVAGFGLDAPFGLGTHWGDKTPFTPLAINTELTYATGWAVLGYEITDTISIGGGFGLSYADAKFTKMATYPTDFSKFTGDGEALSWTISALWKPSEQHSFGAVYRSKSDFNLKGDADALLVGNQNASMDFMTPSTLGVGYAFKPNSCWSFEANIEYVNWDQLNSLTLDKASGAQSIRFDWESNLIYSVGGTRFFDNGWNVSAGYNFIENSQPDATFNPGICDANRHWLNAGFGCKYEKFQWNFAYQYAFSDRNVTGSPFGLADGTYKSRFQGLMLDCNWQF